MDPLSLAVGAAAAGLGLWRAVSVWRSQINAHYLLRALEKLIGSGNLARAIKLCSAAPNSTLANACKAGLERSTDRGDDIDARRSDVISAFNTAAAAGIARLEKHALLGWISIALGVMAIILGLSATPPSLLAAGLGGVGILGTLSSLMHLRRLRRDCRRGGSGLIEALETAWRNDPDESPGNLDRARREVDEIGAVLGLVGPAKTNVATPTRPNPAKPTDVAGAIPERPMLADMRKGSCAICRSDDIGEHAEPNRPGFALFVCRSCGYSQLFAENPAAH